MTIYLAIRSDAKHSRSISPKRLEEILSSWPEFRKAGVTLYEVIHAGSSCAWLDAMACSAEGNYAVFQGSPAPLAINLLEIRYPYAACEHEAWFNALAVRLAQNLGWEAWGADDDGNAIQLCPPN